MSGGLCVRALTHTQKTGERGTVVPSPKESLGCVSGYLGVMSNRERASLAAALPPKERRTRRPAEGRAPAIRGPE